MSRKRNDRHYLYDIQDAIVQIQKYVEGQSFEQFLSDRKTQDAVVRNLEIIGEAAKHISQPLKQRHPEIPWKSMAGVRDRLVHDYFGINYEIVWKIIKEELPTLIADLRNALAGKE